MPARGHRPGLCLAVADGAEHGEVGVVESGAVGMRKSVAELAALVDRAGRLRGYVAGDAAGEGELAEEAPHAIDVTADVRVNLAVGALQVDVGEDRRARRDRGR